MARYIVQRVLSSLIMLGIISVLIFVVLRLLPGDPVTTKLGAARGIDPQAIAKMRADLGLDRPVLAQYWDWVHGLLTGDLGRSYFSDYAVGELVGQRLLPTLELAVFGLILAVFLAVLLAVAPVIWRNRSLSRAVAGYTTFGLSAPPFVIGIIFIIVFSVSLGWLPTKGYVPLTESVSQNLRQVLLPALTLGIAVSAPLIRYLRASITDVQTALYVRTAIGKGLSRRAVVLRHVLPNALLPALTSLGVSVGTLLGGVVVVEYVFSWPGLGSAVVDAVFKRDYAVIQSMVLLAAAVFVAVTLLVDVLYGVFDPRLRVGGAGGGHGE